MVTGDIGSPGKRIERFYIRTRGMRFTVDEADMLGIRRVYNAASDLAYMSLIDQERWASSLYNSMAGESSIVESATKKVNGSEIYVTSCIVFCSKEMANLFYMRYHKTYRHIEGFMHLVN